MKRVHRLLGPERLAGMRVESRPDSAIRVVECESMPPDDAALVSDSHIVFMGINRQNPPLRLSNVLRETVEREMRATVDHWERVFACHMYRSDADNEAQFTRFFLTYALTPHADTGDERHGDWEYGEVGR